MFRKHHDPGLPPVPPLMVNAEQTKAYIKLRVPDWRAVERARYATGACVVLYGILAITSTWFVLPLSPDLITHALICGLISAVSIAMTTPIMKSALPGFLSRQVFARRLKIACTADWLAFRSWYYDNGIRISRRTADIALTIQPLVEDDVDAKAHADSLPAKKSDEWGDSRKHLDQASLLTLMIRSGSEVGDIDQMTAGRRFRTLAVAGMDKKLAERLVILIDAAMELTAQNSTYNPRDAKGRDLDLMTETD